MLKMETCRFQQDFLKKKNKKKKSIFISKYLAAVKFVLRLLCDDGAHLKIC